MSDQTDGEMYHLLLKDTGVKLIVVNFRKYDVDTPSPSTRNEDIEEQKDVDKGCKNISDYVVHVDPNNLKDAPLGLADCITEAMTDYLKVRVEAQELAMERCRVQAQTIGSLRHSEAQVSHN